MIQNDIFSEIQLITSKLIETGMSIQQNFPVKEKLKITWMNESDLSKALRNIPYSEKYKIIDESNNYNIKLLDGGLIQLQYEFSNNGKNLCGHRLAFFPSPGLENFEEAPEAYQNEYFGKSEFHDLFDENIVVFPIRFDFSNDPKKYKELDHPYSHVHLGEYENCRIPVTSPVSPSEFINFLLRNFYNTALQKNKRGLHLGIKNKFDQKISNEEKKMIHVFCR